MKHVRLKNLVRYSGLLPLIALVALLFLVALPREQSFVVNVETRGLEIDFQDRRSYIWDFDKLTVCDGSKNETSASSKSTKLCGQRRFVELEFNGGTLEFASGTTVELTLDTDGPLSIFTKNPEFENAFFVDGQGFAQKSPLLIRHPETSVNGALPFTGVISVGALPSSGEFGLMTSGTYEIRAHPLLSSKSVALTSGEFFPGDRITFESEHDQQSIQSTGHLYFDESGQIGAQFLTEPSKGVLKIDRLGAEPAFISASWIDRLLNDPRIVFFSLLLALLGGAINVAKKSALALLSKKRSTPNRPGPR